MDDIVKKLILEFPSLKFEYVAGGLGSYMVTNPEVTTSKVVRLVCHEYNQQDIKKIYKFTKKILNKMSIYTTRQTKRSKHYEAMARFFTGENLI